MGYFDGLANASFAKDIDGNSVFYPWGVLAKGRILPDVATELKLRNFVKNYLKITLISSISVGFVGNLAWSILLPHRLLILALGLIFFISLFGSVLWFYMRTKSLVSGFPYSRTKLTLQRGYANSAVGHNKFTLWALFISSMMFVVGGFFMAFNSHARTHLFISLLAIVFFGACSFAIGYMLKTKYKK